jgi:hypothetical protein
VVIFFELGGLFKAPFSSPGEAENNPFTMLAEEIDISNSVSEVTEAGTDDERNDGGTGVFCMEEVLDSG